MPLLPGNILSVAYAGHSLPTNFGSQAVDMHEEIANLRSKCQSHSCMAGLGIDRPGSDIDKLQSMLQEIDTSEDAQSSGVRTHPFGKAWLQIRSDFLLFFQIDKMALDVSVAIRTHEFSFLTPLSLLLVQKPYLCIECCYWYQ